MTDLEMFRMIATKDNINNVKSQFEKSHKHDGQDTIQFSYNTGGIYWQEFDVEGSDWSFDGISSFIVIARGMLEDYVEFLFNKQTGELILSDAFMTPTIETAAHVSGGVTLGVDEMNKYLK